MLIVVTVGFEQASYNVSEASGTVEICILVTSPTPVAFSMITLITQTRDVTAKGNYFCDKSNCSNTDVWFQMVTIS